MNKLYFVLLILSGLVIGCDLVDVEKKTGRAAEILEEIEGGAEKAQPIIEMIEDVTGRDLTAPQIERIAQFIKDNEDTGTALTGLTGTPIDDHIWKILIALAGTAGVIFQKRKTKAVAKAAAKWASAFRGGGKSEVLEAAEAEGVKKEIAAAIAAIESEEA